jgi:CxxC motif-containing protein (DUF1111 family)
MLHDGRALNIRDAILAHDGQGAESRRAFESLSAFDRLALSAFLNSL